MNLRGSDRLRMLLLGAAAAGVFSQHPGYAAGPTPAAPAAKKPFFHLGKPASPPPQLLPMTEADATIQPVARTENPPASGSGEKKSEVMRQLELLYQQDGREMPELNTDIKPTPVPGPNGSTPATGSKQPAAAPAPAAGIRTQQPAAGQNVRSPQPVPNPAQAAAPNSPATPAAPPAKSKNPVVAFFKKLGPGSKDPKPTAAPAQYRPDVAPVPPAIVQQPAQPLNRVATVSADPGLPQLDSKPRVPAYGPPTTNVLSAPLAILDIPPAPSGDLPAQAAEASLLPPMLVEPMPAGELANLPAPDSGKGAETSSPFSEMSESEADKKIENPFTGLTLGEDSGKASSGPKAETAKDGAPLSPPEEDPFADELKKMGIVPPGAEKPQPAQLAEPAKVIEPATKLAPPGDTPTFDGIEDQATREKMKKIHERGTMKGLKGFCPVSLRDQRELKDAKLEFHSTFRGQKFHFADAESKLKFDEEPARFAPAAYGADVVALTRDKDVVEGSLDFAAWFKGRLYLFGTQESHDTFVANPAAYATPVGIE